MPRRSGKGKFIKGPIPLEWLRRANECGGQALAVGMLLWFERGIHKNPITLSHKLLSKLGVRPDAGSRALGQLERAGLVTVVRKPGNAPRVTIVDELADSNA